MALFLVALAQTVMAAEANPQTARHRYDIAAMPLDMALARFSEISGIDVLLHQPEAGQRQAPSVKGELSAAEALSLLLRGSGLVARFTSARSVVIVPVEAAQAPWPLRSGAAASSQALIDLDMMHVTAPRIIGSPGPNADDVFARQLVGAIRRAIMEEGLFEGGKSTDVRIATRISRGGELFDVKIVRRSRDQRVDARIAAFLEGADLDVIPPDGLRQPLIFDLSGR